MDKLQLTGQNLGRVFNSRYDCVHAMQLHCSETKVPNLKLKTRPKLPEYPPLDIELPDAKLGDTVLYVKYLNRFFELVVELSKIQCEARKPN